MKVDVMRQGDEFGIFSFFTGAGFLDLGFEDAGDGTASSQHSTAVA